MTSLSYLDYSIIIGVLLVIFSVGVAMSRRASKNLESYFLGGRKLPWYMLGITGMSGWFDLTGTMIITSFLFMLGPKGLYVEFRGGACLVLAFMLAYTAKWHRRSGCMTGAEWATYRFGTGFSGELLRLVTAIMGIVITIGSLAYLVRGATLFMGMVFPFDPVWLTLGLLVMASTYTVMAGFYGVVLADMVQGTIIITSSIIVSVIAWQQIPNAHALAEVARHVTGNANWIASAPAWHVDMPKGYEAYESLIMAAAFYLLRNVLGGMGSGTESRFFAARNSREASLQCLLQGAAIMFRWPLMISIACLGIYLIAKTVPEKSVSVQVAEAIHAANPSLTTAEWHGYTSWLVHNPDKAPPELMEKVEGLLGKKWQAPLLVINPIGQVNPELVLPAVLLQSIPTGLRGFIIVALVAAMMGALTTYVNGASALFVRDIYQNFLRPKAANRELITSAYLSSGLIVIVSFVLGLAASSINDLWSWIIMGLTAGSLGPQLLRLYWWRTNAWGMAAGTLGGGLAAVIQRFTVPHLSEWWQFTIMTGISFLAVIVVSLLTSTTPRDVVRYFHRTTKPFGAWGPFWKELSESDKAAWSREHRNDIISSVVALIWQVSLLLLPMQFLTHNLEAFRNTLPIFLATCLGLYFFWWKNLPPANEIIADFASKPPPPHDPLTLEAARSDATGEA